MAELPGRDAELAQLEELLAKGTSVAVLGGPGIGKTALVEQAFSGLDAGELVRVAPGDAPEGALEGKLVLLEELDRLEQRIMEIALQKVSEAKPRAIVVTGGRALRRSLPSLRRTKSLVPIVLGTLSREASEAVAEKVDPSHRRALLRRTGGHPYLLRLMLDAWDAAEEEPALAAEAKVGEAAAAVCTSVARQVRSGPETQLLDHLVQLGEPCTPAGAAAAIGLHRANAAGDVLAMLGTVTRMRDSGILRLSANCGMFNDWWQADRG